MSPTSATELIPPWALALWAEPNTRTALLLIGAAAFVLLVLPGGKRSQNTQPRARGGEDDELDVKRPTNTSWLLRLWWRIRPPRDLMVIDGVMINRDRKPHNLWLGPTGAGKSASVATTRCDGKRPMLLVMPDLSDPLREQTERLGGVIWTACKAGVTINFLIGAATEVAERLTEVFRSGGTGAWKRAARRATAQCIRDMDDALEPRTLLGIGLRLQAMARTDRELRLVCAGWIDRFLDLADQLGPSMGAGGQDIADLLNKGMTVLLDNDAFDHPSLGGDVVALGLAEAKRCASLVPGGFRLVFEEAGQLGERIDLADPFFRAGRRRKIAVDALTQAESDLNEAISANTATRVYFAQELKSLQKVAADRLGLDYRELDPSRMQDFTAWLAHSKIRALVHFPKPPKPLKSRVSRRETRQQTIPFEKGRTDPRDSKGRRIAVWEVMPKSTSGGVRVEEVRPSLPMLPPPGVTVQKYLDGTYRERGCLRWRGKHDGKGYGYIYLEEEEKSELVHRWRWKQAYGEIGKDPVTNKKLTLDHRDSCFRDCSDLTHLTLKTRGDNSRARWAAERNGVTHG